MAGISSLFWRYPSIRFIIRDNMKKSTPESGQSEQQLRYHLGIPDDARERDIEPLEVHNGGVSLVMTGSIATIRLFL